MPVQKKKSDVPRKETNDERIRREMFNHPDRSAAELRSDLKCELRLIDENDPQRFQLAYEKKTESYFETALTRMEAAESELPGLRAQVSRLTEENAALRATPGHVEIANLKASNENLQRNLERMENLMGVSGLPRESIVVAATAPQGSMADQYSALKRQESAGEVPRGTASKFYSKNKKQIDGE